MMLNADVRKGVGQMWSGGGVGKGSFLHTPFMGDPLGGHHMADPDFRLGFPSISRLLLCRRGGQSLQPNWMGDHGRICPIWIRHWLLGHRMGVGYFLGVCFNSFPL